ncbi:MAG: FAD-binding domain-containing protein [Luteolibacter sp.]
MKVLVWFKRDLRVEDHPALARAVALGSVLPVYVVEPDYWALPDTSARQWEWIAESLRELQAELGQLGAPLLIRVGDAADILARFCQKFHITRVISHEETGNDRTYQRDLRVAESLKAIGVAWDELPQSAVVRRLRQRDGWAAMREGFMKSPLASRVSAIRPVALLDPGVVPTAEALGLSKDACPNRQLGGRRAGLAMLESFFRHRGEFYRTAMSSPLSAATACSRLSPHLAGGTLSIREVVQAASAHEVSRPGGRWAGAIRSFQSRLAWRDHFMQKLEDEPSIEHLCLHRAAEQLRPGSPDPARLAAWSEAQTGLPFVDACMRYLIAGGWLNFRMRSMLMSFASYQLWLDWRATGAILARRFTDYEPGIHWPQVQMQSGTTGINTPRIYNPVKQGRDHDPHGKFIRRWLPELRDVPDSMLHTPWKWERAGSIIGRSYPEPIVDFEAAQRAARDAIFGFYRGADRTQIAAILKRHASRANRAFPRKASQRAKTQSDTQLTFDL